MKTNNSRLRKLTTTIFFLVFTLVSCTEVTIPEPSENPVLLTYEAQTKQFIIENLHNIERVYSTDKEPEGGGHSIIENDWVRFTLLGYVGMTRELQINVKENTTSQPRTHAVKLASRVGKTVVLTVTQAGKP